MTVERLLTLATNPTPDALQSLRAVAFGTGPEIERLVALRAYMTARQGTAMTESEADDLRRAAAAGKVLVRK